MACAICRTRRPRRFCPGVRGDICSLCCGAEREISVDCPLECEYLGEAHKHEKNPPVDPATLPNRDVAISEEFLEEHRELLLFLANAVSQTALRTPGAVDFDMREALDASVRTRRTMQSGLLYETTPANPLAAAISRAIETAIAEFRKLEAERLGIHKTRDSAILSMLVFLQHLEIYNNNGRKRGRAFVDVLLSLYSEASSGAPPAASSLILP